MAAVKTLYSFGTHLSFIEFGVLAISRAHICEHSTQRNLLCWNHRMNEATTHQAHKLDRIFLVQI